MAKKNKVNGVVLRKIGVIVVRGNFFIRLWWIIARVRESDLRLRCRK